MLLAFGQVGAILLTGQLEQMLPKVADAYKWPIARCLICSVLALSWPLSVVGNLLLFRSVTAAQVVVSGILLASIALYSVANMVALSHRDFRVVAKIRMTNAICTAAAIGVGGLVGPSSNVLTLAYGTGSAASIVWALPLLQRTRAASSLLPILAVLRSTSAAKFVGTVGGSAGLASATLAMPVWALGIGFSEAIAGSFFLARRILSVPTQLLAVTVNEVSYAVLAKSSATQVESHFIAWMKRLKWVALAVAGAGLIAGPLLELILEDDYVSLRNVVWLLTIASVAQFLGVSLGNLVLVLNAEHVRLRWSAIRFTTLGLTLALCLGLGASYLVTVAAVVVMVAGGHLGFLIDMSSQIRRRARREVLGE